MFLISLWPIASQAQSQLSGTVTDKSHAIVVGAALRLRNVSTGTSLHTTTNGSGIYSLPSLQTGTYELSCELKGFKKFEERGLVMETGANRLLDIQLEVGQVTDTVVVQASTPLLDTQPVQ